MSVLGRSGGQDLITCVNHGSNNQGLVFPVRAISAGFALEKRSKTTTKLVHLQTANNFARRRPAYLLVEGEVNTKHNLLCSQRIFAPCVQFQHEADVTHLPHAAYSPRRALEHASIVSSGIQFLNLAELADPCDAIEARRLIARHLPAALNENPRFD